MSQKVFVTYSWDETTSQVVYSFVDFLRKNGFEAECDRNRIQVETAGNFSAIMNRGLQYPKVIVVLSESYKRKAESDVGGVGKEYKIISEDIDNNKDKYILVSFEGVSTNVRKRIVPILYQSYEVIDLKKDEESDFNTLFSKLKGEEVIKFSDVASRTPSIKKVILPQFSLKEETQKKDKKSCRGFGLKEGKCENTIDIRKYKLCKECYLAEFKTEIYNIYAAQGYKLDDYCNNAFIATLDYGIITTRVLVGVGIYYDNEFDDKQIYSLDSVKNNLKNQIDKTHLIVNKTLDSESRKLTERLCIEVFTENELTKKMLDLTNYFEEFVKEYEQNPIDKHYIPLSDIYGNSLMNNVISFINSDKEKAQLILGEYGSGKTSFCMHLTYKLIKQFNRYKNSYIPILIFLKDYSKSSIDELLTNFFINKYRINNGNIHTFNQLLKYRKVLLIFDGYDEVSKRVDYDMKFRVYKEICKYGIGNTKIILTCRPNFFQDLNEYNEIFQDSYLHYEPTEYNKISFNETHIKELNKVQIMSFLDSHSKELNKIGLEISEFYKIIRTTHDLWDLSKRPFLLSIIIKTLPKIILDSRSRLEKEKGKTITINASNLYEIYTDDWLKREDNKGKTLIKASEKKMFCENLAFKMFSDDILSINYRDLPDQIKQHFSKLRDIIDIDYFRHDIQSCSFLKSDGSGNYSFIHTSFMEFFVAKSIVQKLCNIYHLLSGITKPTAETINDINQILGKNYITTEISLFISDLLRKSEIEKVEIQTLLARSLVNLDSIAQKNSLSILAKTDINLGPLLNSINLKDLEGIDLSYAKIFNVSLHKIKFINASFYKARIENVVFNSLLLGAKFQKAKIKSSIFGHDLDYSNWSFATLSECDFSDAVLACANFKNAKISKCNFMDAEFSDIKVNEFTKFIDCENMDTILGMPYEMESILTS